MSSGRDGKEDHHHEMFVCRRKKAQALSDKKAKMFCVVVFISIILTLVFTTYISYAFNLS